MNLSNQKGITEKVGTKGTTYQVTSPFSKTFKTLREAQNAQQSYLKNRLETLKAVGTNWKPIKNYPDYLICEEGKVISCRSFNYKLLAPAIESSGRDLFGFSSEEGRVTKYAHKVVAETYLNFKDDGTTFIKHIDGNIGNYCLSNLEVIEKNERVQSENVSKYIKKRINQRSVVFTVNMDKEYTFDTLEEATEFKYIKLAQSREAYTANERDQSMKWKTLKEFPDYDISEFGDIISYRTINPKQLSSSYDLNKGYVSHGLVDFLGKSVRLYKHQLVAMAFNNIKLKKGLEIDHIDHDTKNNHYSNLQQLTTRANVSKGKRRFSKSQKTGVSRGGLKFTATAYFSNKRYSLGSYDTIDQANKAYTGAVRNFELYGLLPA